MQKLIIFIRRGINQFITSGVWRMAVYRDGKLIDITHSFGEKKTVRFYFCLNPIHLLKNLKGEKFT